MRTPIEKWQTALAVVYNTLLNGTLVVTEMKVQTVRWISTAIWAGNSLGKIVASLEAGHPLSTGKAKWNREAISKLLSNENTLAVFCFKKYTEY